MLLDFFFSQKKDFTTAHGFSVYAFEDGPLAQEVEALACCCPSHKACTEGISLVLKPLTMNSCPYLRNPMPSVQVTDISQDLDFSVHSHNPEPKLLNFTPIKISQGHHIPELSFIPIKTSIQLTLSDICPEEFCGIMGTVSPGL